MSRKSQQHRATRKRKEQERRARTSRRAPGENTSERDTENSSYDLIRAGIEFAFGPSKDPIALRDVLNRLARLDANGRTAQNVSDAALFVDHSTDRAFKIGWQPAELVHAVRRELGPGVARLAIAIIGAHASRTSAREKAPPAWIDQLDDLGISADKQDSTSGALVAWRDDERSSSDEVWFGPLALLGYISYLAPMKPLIPVPSEWGSATTTSTRTAHQPESKALRTIRGLLAKAEATSFAAEAEALSAKAQDLMTRYAIDSAVLDARTHTCLADQVATRRILIDNPYPEAKVALLQSVSQTNSVRVLWHQQYGIVSIVGMPVDLDLCDLLFTSLLVQSLHALTEAGRDRDSRSASFRRSFLLAYAAGIGERLAAARERAAEAAASQYGKELVPIIAERAEAVGTVFDEQFPSTTPVAQSITNHRGWTAGRVAADKADITGGRERIDR